VIFTTGSLSKYWFAPTRPTLIDTNKIVPAHRQVAPQIFHQQSPSSQNNREPERCGLDYELCVHDFRGHFRSAGQLAFRSCFMSHFGVMLEVLKDHSSAFIWLRNLSDEVSFATAPRYRRNISGLNGCIRCSMSNWTLRRLYYSAASSSRRWQGWPRTTAPPAKGTQGVRPQASGSMRGLQFRLDERT